MHVPNAAIGWIKVETRREGRRLPAAARDGAEQRREFHEALLDADSCEGLPGKLAAIVRAEQNRPKLRVVSGD